MSSINKVILIGNLGSDPESKAMPTNGLVTTFSIATNERYMPWSNNSPTNKVVEKTEWHRIVAFGKNAETASLYLKKGAKVYVEGSLRTNKWEDREGVNRSTTEVVVDKLTFLSPKTVSEPSESTSDQLELNFAYAIA